MIYILHYDVLCSPVLKLIKTLTYFSLMTRTKFFLWIFSEIKAPVFETSSKTGANISKFLFNMYATYL